MFNQKIASLEARLARLEHHIRRIASQDDSFSKLVIMIANTAKSALPHHTIKEVDSNVETYGGEAKRGFILLANGLDQVSLIVVISKNGKGGYISGSASFTGHDPKKPDFSSLDLEVRINFKEDGTVDLSLLHEFKTEFQKALVQRERREKVLKKYWSVPL